MPGSDPSPYIGRFAPSPTGPLHFGSLVAAAASYLQARANKGKWLLRIEDIDPPREQDGATDAILHSLEAHGFEWDGETIFQSASEDAHFEALQRLTDAGLAYRCTCSRKDLVNAPRSSLGILYPGTCRKGAKDGEHAIRVRTNNEPVRFRDGLQGDFEHELESESGDFVIRRRDGLIAYQLAVVVDDEIEGVTEVVRGIDIIDSTPRQIWLQNCLGYRTPDYMHIPVMTHADGDKLSKLTGAPAIPDSSPGENLFLVLVALKQQPPANLGTAPLKEIWDWSCQNWLPQRLSGNKAVIWPP